MASELASLADVNECGDAAFLALLAPVFEHAGWVAEAVLAARPFPSLTALHQAMMGQLMALPDERVDAFLNGHPRLSARALPAGTTAESVHEQSSAGLARLDPATAARLDGLNAAYEARFGFPFILAVRHASVATLLASFERRVGASVEAERLEALGEISAISWMRLLERVAPASGGLSTHVLDTSRATPGAGMGVELWRGGERLGGWVTDAKGRCDVPEGVAAGAGTYEWRFDTASYFAGRGLGTVQRTFLGGVRVAFTVWNPEEHFHVPLLLSPGGYTTYRGS